MPAPMRFPLSLFAAGMLAGVAIFSAHATSVTSAIGFEDPWVRAAPSVAKVMAGYGTLHNPLQTAVRIESLSSPAFERVELHEMSMAGGVMKMRRRDPYTLEAGQDLVLEPGGWHLMLIGPKAPQAEGTFVTVRINTDQGTHEFSLPVRKPAP